MVRIQTPTKIEGILQRRIYQLEKAIQWALGEGGEFPPRQDGDGFYYWRAHLRKLSNKNSAFNDSQALLLEMNSVKRLANSVNQCLHTKIKVYRNPDKKRSWRGELYARSLDLDDEKWRCIYKTTQPTEVKANARCQTARIESIYSIIMEHLTLDWGFVTSENLEGE